MNISGETLSVFDGNEWAETTIGTGTVVIFAVPGAFTPTCSESYLPGYIAKADELKAKGVDEIYCLSVNDKFVMQAWAKTYGDTNGIKFIADGSVKFTTKHNQVLDLTEMGLGIRSKRYAMIIKNGEVTKTTYDEESFVEQVIELV